MAVDTPARSSRSSRSAPAAPAGPWAARWKEIWPPALALLPLGLLTVSFWYGRHVRPSADEWCFLPVVRDDGIWGLADKFWSTDNGRVGNGLLVGLYAEFPVAGHQWYGPVSGALMLGLLWALTAALLRRTGTRAPRGVPLLAAAMITAVFLFATPNTYKTFYWPAASVSHTLAPVLCAAAAIPLLRARGRAGRIAALAVVAVAGVFMGTLSEEASVVSLVVLGGAVLAAGRLLVPDAARAVRVWSLTGIAGVGAGTLLLISSPGSRNRRSRFDAESVSMLAPESLWGSLRGFAEILGTVLTTWQYVGAVAAGAVLGLLARRAPGAAAGRARAVFRPVRPSLPLTLGAAAFLVSGYLCTVITYPVFGARVVTTERTWNDYLLLYVLLLAAAGVLIGRRLRDRGPAPAGAAALGAGALCALAVAGLAVPLEALGDRMSVRAQQWDRQDSRLRAGAAAGETVMPYTPTRVGKMLEPFSRDGKGYWPAGCVADFYGLERVTYAPPER
ncbi:DUF6056 family protein [Streptomyces sp. NPDC001985]|uniref:DUF6056 family protein n=1 Tax=Streptomyces sp. NPDC001985 TaxID=3154406 RepID=UPI00332CCF18